MEARDTDTNAIAAAAERPESETLGWRAQTFVANRDAIIITNLEGRILDWNPAAERIFGYSRDEILGKSTAVLHHPEDAGMLSATILDSLTRDGSWRGEAPYLRKDGVAGVTETSVQPLLDEAGAIIGAFGVSRDITERKQRKEERRALRASEQAARAAAEAERARLRAILDVLPAGVALYDASGELVEINPEGQRLTQRTALPGETPEDRQRRYALRHADGTPMAEEESPSGRSRRGETFSNVEFVVEGAHGPETHILTSGAPLPPGIADGAPGNGSVSAPGSVVVFQDVTELRRLEHTAREQRDLAEAIINSTAFGIALFDVSDDFRCLRHNAPFLELTGPDMRARGSAVGATLDEFFDADSGARIRAIFERVRDTGEQVVVEEFPAVLPPDPEPRWYKWSLRPLRDARGAITGMLQTAIEISEQVRSRQRLEAIFAAIADSLFVYDVNGRIVQMNAAALKLVGATSEEDYRARPLDERINALLPHDAQGKPLPKDLWPITRTLAGEVLTGAGTTDVRVHTLDGRTLDLGVSSAAVRDHLGNITGAVSVFRDVTERRQLEREATARAAELEGIFEAMTAAVVLFDADASVTHVNNAARELYARAGGSDAHTLSFAERLLNQVLLDEHDEPLPPERWPASRILRGENIMGADAEVSFLTRDGQRLRMSLNGVPLRDNTGAIVGGIALYQDVTERRRLEQRTREALDALLEMAQTLVALPDEAAGHPNHDQQTPATDDASSVEGMIAHRLALLTCGVLGCRRVGITEVAPETELLRAVAVVGLEPEQEKRWWEEQREIERHGMRLGDGADPAELARFRAGEVFMLDMTEPRFRDLPNPYGVTTTLIAPMRAGNRLVGMLSLDYGGPPHVFTPDEMALAGAVAQLGAVALERERLLRERSEARASALALTEANRLMDEFLGVASHELRTPLTSMQANVQLIERRMRKLVSAASHGDEEGRLAANLPGLVAPITTLVDRTERQLRRLNRLVNDLLDVSRIQAGRLEFLPEPRELIAIVKEAVEEQRAAWPERVIALEYMPRHIMVNADGDRIGQVITNYLTNALKYSPPETAVAVRASVRNGAVRVETRDDGPGLSAREQVHLFERFYRVSGIEQQSGSGMGLGLGLYICKTIIERHGGQVGVESAPGKGSVFWFTLPIEPAAGKTRVTPE